MWINHAQEGCVEHVEYDLEQVHIEHAKEVVAKEGIKSAAVTFKGLCGISA